MKQGHKVVSLLRKEGVAPGGLPFKEYVILCERCGLGLDSIQNFRPVPKTPINEQKPKEKDDAQEA